MRYPTLQERRNRQILADIVRTYIETGEPVSSRAISKRFDESLSTATIRNVMADLEDGGYLFQPHTSAGRVPTAAAYRFFAQEIATQATLNLDDQEWIRREMAAGTSAVELTERAGHVLAEVSKGIGIIVAPPLRKTVLEHARMWLLPDGRVVVVLISPGGNTRDKILRPARPFTQQELDATADFLNSHYGERTLRRHRPQRAYAVRSGNPGRRPGAASLCGRHRANCWCAGICGPDATARLAGRNRGEASTGDRPERLHRNS
jgi:heat-inducible transcriptional repressor